MKPDAREKFRADLDEEFLLGGVMLSEWCNFIVCECDTAFVAGADLATIILAVSAIETYLRAEYPRTRKADLYNLIENAPIAADLKMEIHALRRYRNRWVHVESPELDQDLLDDPGRYVQELEKMAHVGVRTLRRTIYENQWI
jgi:hypothetical protein